MAVTLVYRVRSVGELGIPSESHAQASSDPGQVAGYVESRGEFTGEEQELVEIDLSRMDPSEYQFLPHPSGAVWVKFLSPVPEHLVTRVNDWQSVERELDAFMRQIELDVVLGLVD